MAFLPVWVLLISTPYVLSSNTSCSTNRRKRHFSIARSSVAFQSNFLIKCGVGGGDKSHDSWTRPIDHDYPFHRMSGRIDDNSRTFTSETSDDKTSSTLTFLTSQHYTDVSRRAAVLRVLSLSVLSAGFPDSSLGSEIDATGQLFTPKNEMIKGGGSASARGIKLKPLEEKKSRDRKNNNLLKSSGLIQNVYETRFITYLARFLLVFDPSANAWWKKNSISYIISPDAGSVKKDVSKERFAEFAESVEVGLADYFLGPYGSYASIEAAKAGITAAEPAKSVTRAQSTNRSQLKSRKAEREALNLARQGILNLFTLLKARYTSVEAKQQLAILFSLIPSPELQPVQEIRGLLGEVDNGTIAAVELFDVSDDDEAVEVFRLSSRHGGGFSKSDNELIRVEAPAPLGDEYKAARLRAIIKPTSRILRINVIDGGQGYTVSPDVIVKQRGASRDCEACAIIDREGSVSEIILIDPGFGYGGQQNREGSEPTLPTIEIRERKSRQSNPGTEVKPAKAVAELEYSVILFVFAIIIFCLILVCAYLLRINFRLQVVGVDILDGGSGYLFDQPPKVALVLPQTDPDWFATPMTLLDTEDDDENQVILASVTQMKSGGDGIIIDPKAVRKGRDDFQLGDDILRKIKSDPISLLPPIIRPQYSKFIDDASPSVIAKGYYYIPSLPPINRDAALPSSKYRSIDPLFGPLGKAPVIKNALTLSSSQYFRLAISGALCTVLVRTLLNPLELVKTKIQLGTDEEIIKPVMNASPKHGSPESTATIGTSEVIKRMIEVRGPLSLFQSADITLLTSVVFGLLGFGATELFRRSFSAVFFDETAAGPSEVLLLAAAALATLLTCAFGAPFEILRVRSMSTTENQGVKKVFEDFVVR